MTLTFTLYQMEIDVSFKPNGVLNLMVLHHDTLCVVFIALGFTKKCIFTKFSDEFQRFFKSSKALNFT